MAREGRAGTRAGAGAAGSSHDAGNMVLPVQGTAQGHSGHEALVILQAVLEPGTPSMEVTFFT